VPTSGKDFLTTRWSLVQAAGAGDAPSARDALEELAAAYWYPLYAYARRRGLDPEDACDLTQGFFARVLERRDLARLGPEGGRFRSWLLVSLRNHLAGERERERALKRGGGATSRSIDAAVAEERWRHEPATDETPERAFERAWALAVLARVFAALEAEYEQDDKGALFRSLKPTLTGEPGDAPRRALAAELELTENALNVAAHRLRERFRRRLRAEVAHTLTDPTEVEGEVRALFEALAG
jgi:RNA polymerase sigma-70 factor (ECF subfamily)